MRGTSDQALLSSEYPSYGYRRAPAPNVKSMFWLLLCLPMGINAAKFNEAETSAGRRFIGSS